MEVYGFLTYVERMTGVGRYAAELAKRTATKFIIYGAPFQKEENNKVYLQGFPRFPVLKTLINNLVYGPIKFRNFKADIYHAYYHHSAIPLILAKRKPLVVTIPDLIPRLFPLSVSPTFACWDYICALAARRADLIICYSRSAKMDLQRILNVPPEKIRVIPLGVDDKFRVIGSSKESVKKDLGIKNPFIYTVSTLKPLKNLDSVINALHELKGKFKDLKLYVTGAEVWRYSHIFALVRELGLQSDVVFLKHLSDEDLVKYYNAADVFVFPSKYEGFGLPPLEAMACGTPVISSNRSSLPEVVGNAGMLVDPNANELANAVKELLTNDALARELSERGLERAKQFTWDRTAERTVMVYEEVLKS